MRHPFDKIGQKYLLEQMNLLLTYIANYSLECDGKEFRDSLWNKLNECKQILNKENEKHA
jgi:hypothetical protein